MKPQTLLLDGRAYRWKDILAARRAQLAACRTTADQPTLFPLRDDARPQAERTASGRYRQPSLFAE